MTYLLILMLLRPISLANQLQGKEPHEIVRIIWNKVRKQTGLEFNTCRFCGVLIDNEGYCKMCHPEQIIMPDWNRAITNGLESSV